MAPSIFAYIDKAGRPLPAIVLQIISFGSAWGRTGILTQSPGVLWFLGLYQRGVGRQRRLQLAARIEWPLVLLLLGKHLSLAYSFPICLAGTRKAVGGHSVEESLWGPRQLCWLDARDFVSHCYLLCGPIRKSLITVVLGVPDCQSSPLEDLLTPNPFSNHILLLPSSLRCGLSGNSSPGIGRCGSRLRRWILTLAGGTLIWNPSPRNITERVWSGRCAFSTSFARYLAASCNM
jgi:hypothetical protein